MTLEKLTKLGSNDRQIKAVLILKGSGIITNKGYQEMNETTERTTSTCKQGFLRLRRAGVLRITEMY
jgi:hypothetical protein